MEKKRKDFSDCDAFGQRRDGKKSILMYNVYIRFEKPMPDINHRFAFHSTLNDSKCCHWDSFTPCTPAMYNMYDLGIGHTEHWTLNT